MRSLQLLTALTLLAACGEPAGPPGAGAQAPQVAAEAPLDDLPGRPGDPDEALSTDPAERVSHFAELLRGGTENEQKRASHELAILGKDAVPQLIELLAVDRAAGWTCEALAEIGADAAAAAPALVERLADPDVRVQARFALLEIGEPARGPLEEALASDDPEVRSAAAWVLERLGAPDGPR